VLLRKSLLVTCWLLAAVVVVVVLRGRGVLNEVLVVVVLVHQFLRRFLV
jgi:hypothetical protein